MNIKKLAIEAIEKIIYKGAFVNICINEYFNKFELTKEEKALFTRLVMGTIEKRITLAYYLEPYLRKKQKPWVNAILLMSVYQIVYMDIENHYAVNDAVEMANFKDRNIGGFVNGVLRNLLRNPLRSIDKASLDEIQYLSIKYSYPTWLVSYLLKDYDYKVVEDIFKENDEIRGTTIRVNTLKASLKEVCDILESENITYKKSLISDNGLIVDYPMVNHDLFISGKITIQDVASQMTSEILNPSHESNVIDMCSAPGSKTAHLASIMENTGRIFACDIYAHKLKLMEKGFKRLGVTNVKTQQIDARKVKDVVKKESFDYVLLDMPCSGLGVMGHKVDLKYNITYESIEEIIKLQKELIESAYPLIKKGGYIVISTCTINKSENEENIKEFIRNHKDMKVLYERCILPYEYNTDGFFICKLQKETINA